MKGQVISGKFGEICIRQKSDQELELGELLIADTKNGKILLQVYDLLYGSQISQQNLELISGMNLEQNSDLELYDPELRNYKLGLLKPLITIDKTNARIPKELPNFFSPVREIKKDDLSFLTKPKSPLKFGKLRSGSKTVDVDILLDGQKVLSHHILIAGTTGRGKSVLMSNLLWDTIDKDYAGVLVLDPHDEYYGRNKLGLKDHEKHDSVIYYSINPPAGARTLKINIETIRPAHLKGVLDLSDPQQQAIQSYYKEYKEKWIEAIIKEKELQVEFYAATVAVVKRRLMALLNLRFKNNELFSSGVFDLQAGSTTIKDIVNELEQAKTVIIDTSSFEGKAELLIGSLIATSALNKYKSYKRDGILNTKPIISIVLEEAPRVLGKEVLEKTSNIFATIAREGRKFQIGLIAITQLPSLIPRQILANMNTKIILGIEMAPERQAIIDSAAQDLSTDNRNIASLDKGEAIITSNFARFAIPVKIPFFDNIVKTEKIKFKQSFKEIEG